MRPGSRLTRVRTPRGNARVGTGRSITVKRNARGVANPGRGLDLRARAPAPARAVVDALTAGVFPRADTCVTRVRLGRYMAAISLLGYPLRAGGSTPTHVPM